MGIKLDYKTECGLPAKPQGQAKSISDQQRDYLVDKLGREFVEWLEEVDDADK